MSEVIKEKRENTANAVDKTTSVLDYLAEKDASFTELQQSLHLPKATLHRILHSLEQAEYIRKDPFSEQYSLGIKFIYYGHMVRSRTSLVSVTEPLLKALVNEIGENVGLSILYQRIVFSLLSIPGDTWALASKLMPVYALNSSASGKLFLSHMPDAAIRAYFEEEKLVRNTTNTIFTYEEFKRVQPKILAEDIAYDDEECEYGLYCMAVPLRNHQGVIPASIGMTGPKARIFMKDPAKLADKLCACGEEISETLRLIRYEFEY